MRHTRCQGMSFLFSVSTAVSQMIQFVLQQSLDLPPAKTMQRWCRRYHGRGYGGMFREWRDSDDPEPYNSYGNGAAMRVSPAAFLYRDNLDAALAAADRVTAITHNHPEGMKGARATAHAIWLAFQGESADTLGLQ